MCQSQSLAELEDEWAALDPLGLELACDEPSYFESDSEPLVLEFPLELEPACEAEELDFDDSAPLDAAALDDLDPACDPLDEDIDWEESFEFAWEDEEPTLLPLT